jgi:hypothetical protein
MLTTDYTNELEKKMDYVTQYNSMDYFTSKLRKVFLANPVTAQYVIIL